MAYGTPEREDDLLAYYTDIRRGRPPTDEQLADLRRRYDAIGGLSPLAGLTRAQAAAVDVALGDGWIVELGLKHAAPFIEDGVRSLLERGATSITGIVLAPHTSALSTNQYHDRAAATVDEATAADVTYAAVPRWGHDAALVDLLAERVRSTAAQMAADGVRDAEVLVTAHSLPERARGMDQPSYPDQLQQTADLVAAAAGVSADRCRIAWQSAGRTPEPWIGPDILEVIRSLAGERDGVMICPAGFTADHLEVLYDVDIEAAAVAADAGLALARTASLNDDPVFVDLVADLVVRASEGPATRLARS